MCNLIASESQSSPRPPMRSIGLTVGEVLGSTGRQLACRSAVGLRGQWGQAHERCINVAFLLSHWTWYGCYSLRVCICNLTQIPFFPVCVVMVVYIINVFCLLLVVTRAGDSFRCCVPTWVLISEFMFMIISSLKITCYQCWAVAVLKAVAVQV